MKDKLIYIGIFCFLFMACSLDDVLKTSDKVNVEIMESTDTVRPLPGDTISFKFLLSTNGGTLKRLEITDKTFDFDVVPENIRFAMVDTSLKLSLDANGYFSRPVSTVLVMYPMVVPDGYDMIGKVLGMTFRATNTSGKTGESSSCFRISNCKTETRSQSFKSLYGYNALSHRVYSKKEDLMKFQKMIDIIAYKENDKYYYLSPDAPKTFEIMAANQVEWDADSIKTTRLVKMNKVFFRIYDTELNSIDMNEGVDQIEVANGDVIGYVTDGGECRCAVNANVKKIDAPTMVTKHTYMLKSKEEKDENN